jgi:small-conductance mechanosensitive channel/CRP-like cAMP-binding protein
LSWHKSFMIFSILFLLIISSAMINTSLMPSGPLHITLQAFKAILIGLSWITLYVLIKAIFFDRYKRLFKRDVPRIVFMTTKLLIFVAIILSIIVFVLGKSIFSLVALGGLVSAGLTFALGDLILDAFSGVILETESPFELGDWIKPLGGDLGKVVEVNWRTVILQNLEGHLIVIPHRKIAQGFINYNKPEMDYWDKVEITVDHSIPVDRATRILRAGAMQAPSIYDRQCKVKALKTTEGGIVYEIKYKVLDVLKSLDARHDVIEYVIKSLHAYSLRVSEYLGEYAIRKGGRPYQEDLPLSVEKLIRQVDMFKSLPKSAVLKLTEQVKRHVFSEGDKIVSEGEEGESLFMIGEGVVEISIAYKTKSGTKKQKQLFVLSYPGSFGEMALLLNEKRAATVTAMMNTVVYEISQDLLISTLKNHPKILKKLTEQALEKKNKNKMTKTEMESLKEDTEKHPKGLLSKLETFLVG